MTTPNGARTICLLLVVLLLSTASCGPAKRIHDPARELVNAAGLSASETLRVLQSGADVNRRSYSNFGWTALISAIYHHKEDVVDLLLDHGANVNIADHDNRTPLIWAIQSWGDNTNLIANLMRHGADPKTRTRLGSDAFDAAEHQPNGKVIIEILLIRTKKAGSVPTESPANKPDR